ncbi:hypothetical protein GUJ93_ZPchr0008g13081 [Zizania palustris]|uniref:Uncharacterized protein n=1 Tax=Zizania palustris TaxID=103762 RepID=A0A8J5REQ5_ZIZPA|nr:hypothetical protein GUJ93_ZPchr0008g13081 [Zizania palustris]
MLSPTSTGVEDSLRVPSSIGDRPETKEEVPIMVVEVSGSDDEAHPMEGSEGLPVDKRVLLRFIVLAQGAMNSFDEECGRIAAESMTLRDRLGDSEEKASNLEDMLQQEQGRCATFEVKAENLWASQGTAEAEAHAL